MQISRPLLEASAPQGKWWGVEFEAITPAQVATIQEEQQSTEAVERTYQRVKKELAERMVTIAEQFRAEHKATQATAMLKLKKLLLDSQIEFEGPDLARFLRTFDIETAKDQKSIAAFRTELAKQLTPADLAAVAAGPEALAAHFKLDRSALAVTKDVLSTTAWAVTPAILSALVAYLTGSVAALTTLLPGLVALNHTALKNIIEQFKSGVSLNKMSAGDAFRFFCSAAVMMVSVAAAIYIGLTVFGGSISVAAVAAVSAVLLLVQGIYTLGQYFLSSAQSTARAILQAIPGLSDSAKAALGRMSDITLSTLVAASPALLPALLAMYAPTFSEEDTRVLLTEVPKHASELKMTVDMSRPLAGSTMTPVELQSRLQLLQPQLPTSQALSAQQMGLGQLPTSAVGLQMAPALGTSPALSAQQLGLGQLPTSAVGVQMAPALGTSQALSAQQIGLGPLPTSAVGVQMGPQLGTSPAIDAQRAGLRPYQYDALPPNPEMLKNMLAAAVGLEYAQDALLYFIVSMKVMLPMASLLATAAGLL
jgi:hypothetical protein